MFAKFSIHESIVLVKSDSFLLSDNHSSALFRKGLWVWVTVKLIPAFWGLKGIFSDMLRTLSFLGLVTSSSSDFSVERNNGEIGRPDPRNSLPAIATLGEAN